MGLFNLFSKKKITLTEANKENETYVSNHPKAKNGENKLMREASSALTGGEFKKSIELYNLLAENYTENSGLYLSQVGVSYYFLNDFNKAIEYYLKALSNGAASSMMDDNIWEACEEIYERKKDKIQMERYLEWFPNGRYNKKAKKIISE